MDYKICKFITIVLCIDLSLTQRMSDETSNVKFIDFNEEEGEQVSHLDLIIKEILKQNWTTDETPCLHKVLDILNGVKNSTMWATWIWDSMQTPTGTLYGSRYQLGNYDQCMKAPWTETHIEYQTQYCLADIKLSNIEFKNDIVGPYSSVQTYMRTASKMNVTFNTITWGVCVPVDCHSKAISKFVSALYKQTHLAVSMPILEMNIEPCQISGRAPIYTDEYILFILFLTSTTIMAITCTILNCCYHINGDGFGGRIIKAFCMRENAAYLTRSDKDDISVLHGIRSITSGIVVALHVWFVTLWVGFINPLDFDKDTRRYNLDYFSHAELVVDTYLMMSGLLLIKGIMSMRKFNPIMVILKRYLKFASILGLMIIVIVLLMVPCADGPLWLRYAEPERKACTKTWWITLLMLGNYVDTPNICYPILWSVPCDFHLSVIGTILFWVFKKNRRVGIASFSILLIISLILPGIMTYQLKLPPVPVFNVGTIYNYRNFMFSTPTYLWSHLRAGPYFIGLGTGYLMTIYKPGEYRNTITKVWSVLGFFVALCIAMKVLVMGQTFQDISRYNIWEAVVFASFNRTIWALAMACIIAVCEYGTVPIIGPFFKWSVFVPLSKLSYGTYLLHALVFIRVAASTRTPLGYDILTTFFNTFAVIVVSLLISFLLHLFFEAPLAKIINFIFDKTTILQHQQMPQYTNGSLCENEKINTRCNNKKNI